MCFFGCFGVFWCSLVCLSVFGYFHWCFHIRWVGDCLVRLTGRQGALRAPWGRAERRASRGSGAAGAAAPGHRDGQRRLCRRWIVEVGGTPGRGHGPGAARGRLTDAARGSARGRLGWASERGQRDGRSGPSAGRSGGPVQPATGLPGGGAAGPAAGPRGRVFVIVVIFRG